MPKNELDKAKIKFRFTGAGDYRDVYEQEFTHEEAREAADFADLINSYNVSEEMLSSFVSEEMKLGHRLYMILHLPIDQLGVMAMKDPDDRLINIIKQRCSEINKEKEGRKLIVLPSEA